MGGGGGLPRPPDLSAYLLVHLCVFRVVFVLVWFWDTGKGEGEFCTGLCEGGWLGAHICVYVQWGLPRARSPSTVVLACLYRIYMLTQR